MDPIGNHKVYFEDLGELGFDKTWTLQTDFFDSILARKKRNRSLGLTEALQTDNYLFFVEHPHVFTLGKSGSQKNLLVPLKELDSINASYYPINRGGDITYHGPGQIVAYPVLDLENFDPDLGIYLRSLEETVILVLRDYGIDSGRLKGATGVWLDPDSESKARKICAIGVKTSRWVSMHGLAFNVNPDLNYFDYIIPCGIEDKGVTSMEKELGKKVDLNLLKNNLKEKFCEIFGMEMIPFKHQENKKDREHIRG
jgi:lipoyl(octanoyl) transferase